MARPFPLTPVVVAKTRPAQLHLANHWRYRCNYPFELSVNLVAHKVDPAIATGNTSVLKPASTTPISSLILAETLAAVGLPRGAFNMVIGTGSILFAMENRANIKMVMINRSPVYHRQCRWLEL